MLKSNLKYWIEKEGRTNKWIARELGVTQETVSRWINNKSQPSVETLFAIADLFNCKADDLYIRKKGPLLRK